VRIEDKKKVVDEVREKLLKAKVVIVTDYKGLNVSRLNELRAKLREVGVEYRVVKNTLLTRAAEETDAALIQDGFKGPSAVAFSYDDPVAPAKVLTQFAKEHNKPEIKMGVLNGKMIDASEIRALSALPSREVLLAKLLSVMVAVPTSFVRVLNNIPVGLLNVMQALKEKKEATAGE